MGEKRIKRIVVKVGSSTLTHQGGKLNLTRIDHLIRQLVDLKNTGKEILLVTSGAIGAGMGEIGLEKKPRLIPELQAAAAVGQGLLMGVYTKFLREYGEKCAQILLIESDMSDRERYLNAFNTLTTLLKYGVIPVINENDTVATQEIKFGDNDTLSARVAGLVEADLLLNLTDIDGLYNKNPRENSEDIRIIRRVDKITDGIRKLADSHGSELGTGGMFTKIRAAEIATESGIIMVIGPGYQKNVVLDIVKMLEKDKDYYLGTTFLPEENCLSKRKHWLRFNLSPLGLIKVDRGAEDALLYRKKSLLPGGVTGIEGSFASGDLVQIVNIDQHEIGRGIVNYSAQEVEKIKGCHSDEIFFRLGYINQAEIIHRDNMVIKGGE